MKHNISFFFFSLLLGAILIIKPQISNAQENVDWDSMSLEELMRIELITAGKQSEKATDIPASVVLITRKEIELYGYTTLQEIFQNIPGFFVMESYGAADKVFGVRGFFSAYNRNVIIMVNGITQINDYTNDFKLYEINVPVETIDRIEVIRGPMSVIYGNSALFGAINIITNDANDNANVIAAGAGSRNTYKLSSTIQARAEDLHINFNAGYYRTDGINADVSKMVEREITGPDGTLIENPIWDETTGGFYDRTEKYANINGSYKGLYFDMSYAETMKGHSYLNFPPTYNWLRPIANRLQAGYRNDISDQFSIDIRANYYTSRTESRFSFADPNAYSPLFDEVNSYQVETNAFYCPSEKWNITFGLYTRVVDKATQRYDITEIGAGSLERVFLNLHPDDQIINYAGYTQVIYRPIPDLELITGLRLDKFEPYDIFVRRQSGTPNETEFRGTKDMGDELNVIPRAAVLFHINDRNTLKLLYGKAINHSSAISNVDVLIFNATYDEDEPYLEPEEIQTFELNYITNITDNMLLNFSGFYNTLDNLLIREVKFVNGLYSPITSNSGKAATVGAELTTQLHFSNRLQFDVSATYQQTENKRGGYENIEVGFSPNLLGYLKMNYELIDDLNIALTANYIDEMYPMWIGAPETGAYQGDKTGAFYLINTNIRKNNLFVEGMYANLRVYNILNTEYLYPTHEVQLWATKGLTGRGREIMFGLGYKF